MNLIVGYIQATGVTAPPPQTSVTQSMQTPLRQTRPIAPTPAPAVQQSEHATRSAALAARPTSTQNASSAAAEAEETSEGPTVLMAVPAAPGESQRYEALEEARIAWIEGKPRNAPAVWPMFPSEENPGETDATKRAKLAWGMAEIMSSYGAEPTGVQGEVLSDAVRAIREGADSPRTSALGKA